MKTYSVQFTAVAERHLGAISEWWKANRPKAPGLFDREVAGAVEQLMGAPHSGSPYVVARPVGARRLLLTKTSYHVYFTVNDNRSTVTIRAIWHAARGRPPRLR